MKLGLRSEHLQASEKQADRALETKRLCWFLASQISATHDQQEAVKSWVSDSSKAGAQR